MNKLNISVVMATRNRAPHVAGAVDSIMAAIRAEPAVTAEVIVVDNGSSDQTSAVLAKLTETYPTNFKGVLEPLPGVSRARNRGLSIATGDVIVIIDDDCRMAPDYFTALVAHYRDRKGPVILGGRVELGDPTDMPFTIRIEDKPETLGGIVHPGGFLLGANTTLNRQVLDLIGGYDVRFGAGGPLVSAEDTELVVRAVNAGIPVEYVPDIVVHHFHGRKTLESVKKLNRDYQIGNGAMTARHWRTSGILIRHMWWNARNAFYELFGGPPADAALGIRHADNLKANLRGIWLYLHLTVGKKTAEAATDFRASLPSAYLPVEPPTVAAP